MAHEITFLQLAKEILQDSPLPLTQKAIWAKAIEKGLDKKIGHSATPIYSLGAQMYVDVKKPNSIFKKVSTRPTLFGLKEKEYDDKDIVKAQNDTESAKQSFDERDLHPLFVKYANENEYFKCYCKTLFHEKSKKSGKGRDKWIHPDIIGVEFASYKKETLHLLEVLGNPRAKLYAFELKVELDWHNLKESYFQAVSNSSWANEGYLAVFKDIDDELLLQEIQRLNANFGIGLIVFGTKQEDFKIICPAKQKELDIESIDLLIEKNDDFKDFINNAIKDIPQENDRRAISKYDEIKQDNDIEKYIESKHIAR